MLLPPLTAFMNGIGRVLILASPAGARLCKGSGGRVRQVLYKRLLLCFLPKPASELPSVCREAFMAKQRLWLKESEESVALGN